MCKCELAKNCRLTVISCLLEHCQTIPSIVRSRIDSRQSVWHLSQIALSANRPSIIIHCTMSCRPLSNTVYLLNGLLKSRIVMSSIRLLSRRGVEEADPLDIAHYDATCCGNNSFICIGIKTNSKDTCVPLWKLCNSSELFLAHLIQLTALAGNGRVHVSSGKFSSD